MSFAQPQELDEFLQHHPDTQLLELLMPDVNGILRCKRVHRREAKALFDGGFSVPKSVPFLGIRGNMYDCMDQSIIGGDPDQVLRPIAGTLVPVPWYDSPIAQVLTGYANPDGTYAWLDPRAPLMDVLARYAQSGLRPVVATELEFYLLADSEEERPQPFTGRIPGTSLRQGGIQYCMPDDLLECDDFLEDVRLACEIQGVPLTAIHSEFSPGQWEINTHHQSDPARAGDQAMLLRRIVKATARRHGMGATFMAKPFPDTAGNGLHIHASIYGADDDNIFASTAGREPPELTATLRHAVGGLAAALNESMAIFAPNPNSYRRFKAGAFAPSGPSWAYDHREVSLRVPVSSESNRRIEHRVAGADANPYLVLAAVLAAMHWGIEHRADPGEPLPRETDLSDAPITLPKRLDEALNLLENGEIISDYFSELYMKTYLRFRRGESDDYHGNVPNLDYYWFLRAI